MALTRLSDDMDIIVKLDDEPNDVGGLSADELKAEFDEAGNLIKEYLNSVLLVELEQDGASSIGVQNVEGMVATTLKGAFEEILQSMEDITQGSVADGSITVQKLADNAVETAKVKNGNITSAKLADGSVATTKITDSAVTTAKINNKAVTTNKIDDYAVTAKKLGTGSVTEEKLANSAVTNGKIKDGAVTTGKIADGSVTTVKHANASVTRAKLANDALYSPVKEIDTNSYNIAADDLGKTLKFTSTGDVLITISDAVFAAFPTGAEIAILRWTSNATNKITIKIGGTGTTYYMVRSGSASVLGGSVSISSAYGMCALKKITGLSLYASGEID